MESSGKSKTRTTRRSFGALIATAALISGVMGAALSAAGTASAGATSHHQAQTFNLAQRLANATAHRASLAKKFSHLAPATKKIAPSLKTKPKAVALGAVPAATSFFKTIVVTTTKDITGATYATCNTHKATTCSLREALLYAKTLQESTDTTLLPIAITVPEGTYQLTYLTGPFSALRVTAPYGVVVKGAGEASTKIIANTTTTKPDRVIDVGSTSTTASLTLMTLTLTGGRAPFSTSTTTATTMCLNSTTWAAVGGDLADCTTGTSTVLNTVRVTGGAALTGGGIAVQGSMWIVNSTITGNEANPTYTSDVTSTDEPYGGGIVSDGNLKLIDSSVVNNTSASKWDKNVYGGGVFSWFTSTLTITGGTFSTNSATNSDTTGTSALALGGGLFNLGLLEIHGASFNSNAATSTSTDGAAAGGAIFNSGWLQTLSTSTFKANAASGYEAAGGGLENSHPFAPVTVGPVSLTNDLFTTNKVTGIANGGAAVGGGISSVDATLGCTSGITLTHVTLRKNMVTTNGTTLAAGGGLFVLGTAPTCDKNSIVISNSTVSTNSAFATKTDAEGGGIFVTVGYWQLRVTNTTISHNLATTSTGTYTSFGGGVYYSTTTNTLFSNDTISYNEAMSPGESAGGGVDNAGCGCVTTFKNVTVTHNKANQYGAGIDGGSESFVVTSSTIAFNTLTGVGVTAYGAGIDMGATRLTISNSTIVSNVANYTATTTLWSYGGGIDVGVSTLILNFDTITGNSAAAAGGSYIGVMGTGEMTGTVISGNKTIDQTTTLATAPTNCGDSDPVTNGSGNYVGISALWTTDQTCLVSPVTANGTTPKLAPLANNGGNVMTMVPELGSPLLNNGGNACLGIDEIGQHRPSVNCTSGAFQETVGNAYTTFATDGGVFAFPSSLFHGSTGAMTLNKPVVGMASTPDGMGYWLVAADGGIFAFGNAHFYGSLPGLHVSVSNIVGITATPDGMGYWMVGANGGVYAFGDATYKGSLPGLHITVTNVVGLASHGSDGYWMVGGNGAVYAFGSSNYKGGANTLTLNAQIIGIAADPTGEGYWLAGADGGIFGYGIDASKYYGSMGGKHLNKPVVGIASTGDGAGYWLVASDGGIFAFGDASFEGSMGGSVLNKPMVGMS